MSELHFDHLEYLHLLWAVLALGGVYAYGFACRRRALRQFATANLLGRLIPQVSTARQKIKAVLMLVALAALVLALTGPRWGKDIVEVQRRGIDLIVALDVSRSMLAEDIAPSRLERAKVELGDMLRVMRGDRIGLVTFAGEPVVACPLTINYGAYRMTLDEVDVRSSPRGGTQLGDAARLAAESFTDKAKGHKAILVISDGEDQSSFPAEAARKVYEEHGVRVFTVGLGDQVDGARIPVVVNGQRQYLQYEGQEVWTKMNPASLQEMALEGGGIYFGAGTSDPDFTEVYERIRGKVEARELESRRQELYLPRFQWFAGLGLALLLVETLLTERKPSAAAVINGGNGVRS